MKTNLWTKNFIYCFIGTIMSAMGGIGLNIALSVYIYQQTGSTALSGTFAAVSMIPNFIFPLFIGPFIDRRHPLKILVANEVFLGVFYFIIAFATNALPFSYVFFLALTLMISSFGIISELAYQSVIPHIMSKENYSRGNAMLNIIYPMAQVVVTPVALLLFNRFGVSLIFLLYGGLSLIDAFMESRISFDYTVDKAVTSIGEQTRIRQHMTDIKEGFQYFLSEPAIRSVFLYFGISGLAVGITVLWYPYFMSTPGLGDDKYALLTSMNGAGYVVGGLMHYFIKIPSNRKFQIAVVVYLAFSLIEGTFFFVPFIFMALGRFTLGVLGMNSANIRVSALQAYVPNNLRAKTNALFSVLQSLSIMVGQISVGWLGEFLPYWLISIILQVFGVIAVFVFILPKRNKVKEFYNYSYEDN